MSSSFPKSILFQRVQFGTGNLGIRYIVFSFDFKWDCLITPWIIPYHFYHVVLETIFVVNIANFKCCLGYTKVKFFFITRNGCYDICLVDNTLSKKLKETAFYLYSFRAGYLDIFFGVKQFTKFMTCAKVLSYKIWKLAWQHFISMTALGH